jgi:hypothetical protein
MLADQVRRTRLHRRQIKRVPHLPDPAPVMRRGCTAALQAEQIAPLARRKPRVKFIGHPRHLQHGHRQRTQMRVDCTHQADHIPIPRDVDMRDLTGGMHARIGAARACHDIVPRRQMRQGILDGALHRWQVRLPLPARKRAAVIIDQKRIAWHKPGLPQAKALAKGPLLWSFWVCDIGLRYPTVNKMRFLPVLVLAGLPGALWAQGDLGTVQKAAQAAPAIMPSPAELGLPANPDAPKLATLAGSWATDARPSDFDSDKIAGNPEVEPPLAMRTKAPGTLPQPAPDAAALGTGPAGDKTAVLDISRAADSRLTTYDTDKIDGNPEIVAPLADRKKAPGLPAEGTTAADLGHPDATPAPKLADLAVSYAEGAQSDYDDDKIAGNGPTYEPTPSGPLTDRQKRPSDVGAGSDPDDFGVPLTDAPKLAVLEVSKAELAIASIDDNDKIIGNAYVAAPLLPRQKMPAVLPDPVADPDMGLPDGDVAKTDLAVSKAADGRPNIEDNDKIDGNPVVNPPLAARSKLPATTPAVAGLTDADLGIPADTGDAAKTGEVSVARAQEAVLSEYDDDKIAGNSYSDPGIFSDDGYDDFALAPPAELVAQVRSLLDDPAAREAALAGVASRAASPAQVAEAFQGFVAAMYDEATLRDQMAMDIAQTFVEVGLTPEDPAIIGRVAGEYLSAFGQAEARQGVLRLPAPEIRSYVADMARVADTMLPEQCGPYLAGLMDGTQARRLTLAAMATWSAPEVEAALIREAAGIVAHLQDNPPLVPLPGEDAVRVRAQLGETAVTAIFETENPDALLSAYGDPDAAPAADLCDVHRIIVQAALEDATPDADLALRYLLEYGWDR